MKRSNLDRQESDKIVFVANEFGNFWHHRGHLLQAVRNSGLHPFLIAAPVGEMRNFDFEYKAIRLERYRFHLRLDIALFLTVLRALLRDRPRAIHLVNLKPYLFGGLAAQLARICGWKGQIVFTVPGLGRLYMQTQNDPFSKKIRKILVERFLRIAARNVQVTFETNHDREIWLKQKLITPSQAHVTRGTGIDLNYFSAPSKICGSGKLRVLYAGRLLKAKGLDVFLQAATQLDNRKVEMFVAGLVQDDPDSLSLDEIQRQPSITYLGVVENMPELLSTMDVVVLPSRYNEGVPRILIEAASMGCIPVATRFPGSEVVIEDGKTGYFLHSSTCATQATELFGLLSQLAGDMNVRVSVGRNAIDHVRKGGFDSDTISKEFLELYSE